MRNQKELKLSILKTLVSMKLEGQVPQGPEEMGPIRNLSRIRYGALMVLKL